jgi:hypothetical protein
MNAAWLDIAVRTLLGSTLVMTQALMLNWLRVPFAAITLFAGIAAYATVAGVTPVILILFFVTAGFLALVRPLPQDRYLLLSLASLALARSIAGSLSSYGGELGVATTTTWIAAQLPQSALPYAIALFLTAFLVLLLLRHSEIGLAVDVARAAGTEMHAASMSPRGVLTAVLLALVAVLAALTGAVQGAYTGWIDPNLFRIDYAITLLVATLVIGRMPVRGTLLAMSFFLFPDLFSQFCGYDHTVSAHLREILWGAAIIFLAGRTGSPVRGEA